MHENHSMNNTPFRSFVTKFLALEKKHNLLQFDIQGVKIWQARRIYFFYLIAQHYGIYSKAQVSDVGLLKTLLSIPKYLIYAIKKNPLAGKYHRTYLIFDHPRKKWINGAYRDQYTYKLIENLKKEEYDVIESPHQRKHYSPINDKNRKYNDILSVRKYIPKKLSRIKLSHEKLEYIEHIKQDVFKEFGIKLNLVNLFIKHTIDFKLDFRFYKKLLLKRTPEKIFLVVSYNLAPLIKAAKTLKIPVTELQHGTMSNYHVGYHYPDNTPIEYFPDYFYSFGPFWRQTVSWPIPQENIIEYGFPYFIETREKYRTIKKNPNQVIIISQGAIGKDLGNFMAKALHGNEKYRFIYKLHPGEYLNWKTRYPSLKLLDDYQNIEIIDHNKIDLYELFASSEFQIGVFSTAIYEGISFGCKSILINLPGIEYMENLINNRMAIKVSSPSELLNTLSTGHVNHISDRNRFFMPAT